MAQAIEAIQIPPDDGDGREELLNKVEDLGYEVYERARRSAEVRWIGNFKKSNPADFSRRSCTR